ncbi:hypothetical protein FSOLCH5_015363 [Fusarium solani]
MATGTPKQGEVSTVRDKNVDSRKVPSDACNGVLRRSLRRAPRASAPVKHNKPDYFTSGATEQNEPKSINKQRGKKDAKVNGAAPAASGSVGKPLAELGDTSEVDELVEHRVNRGNSTVKFKVKRKASGETAWKTERDLQEKVPALVYKYWDGLGRRDTATRLKLYHVFKILKRASPPEKSKDAQYTHIVQWVGYRPTESTLECESNLQIIAPQELEKFEAKELERGAVKSQKRKNICSPGGPRKKARGANN